MCIFCISWGSPCCHVGWQNCHSPQQSARSILSPYLRVTFWFGHAVTTRSTVHLGGHIWGPYVVRQLSCDVYIVIVLRWKCAVWVCAVVCRYVTLDTHPRVLWVCAVLYCLRGCQAVYDPVPRRSRLFRQRGAGDVFPNGCPPGMWIFGKDSNQRKISSKKSEGRWTLQRGQRVHRAVITESRKASEIEQI